MISAQVNRTGYPHRTRTWFLSGRRTPAARWYLLTIISALLASTAVHAQSTASIEGQITDQNGAVIPNVEIKATSRAIAVDRSALTDDAGRYQIPSLPVGDYRIEVKANGFQTQILESIRVEVARRITEDFQLRVGEASEQVLVGAVAALARHHSYFTDTISQTLHDAFLRSGSRKDKSYGLILTDREREIVQMLTEGRSNREIAVRLQISIKTVETHRASAMRKLNINSIVALAHYAIRNQIVEA